MLGWSFNLFRIRGIQLAVHFSFLLLLAYWADEGWNQDGIHGLLWSVATLLAFFTCVVLHELGHSFTARHYGVGVPRILLMPIGGMAEFDSIPRRPRHELLITIAGPAVNFVIAGILWFIVQFPDDWDPNLAPGSLNELVCVLFAANLVMGCFNLIPVFPMDGGRILRALLAMKLPYLRATFWAASVGKVLAVLGALLMVFLWRNYLGGVLFAFIFMAGEAEYRAVKRRELEDAYWRELFARTRAVPLAGEPPILATDREPPLIT
jgi:Zn-dependent protease